MEAVASELALLLPVLPLGLGVNDQLRLTLQHFP